jgi:hypothetical protein
MVAPARTVATGRGATGSKKPIAHGIIVNSPNLLGERPERRHVWVEFSRDPAGAKLLLATHAQNPRARARAFVSQLIGRRLHPAPGDRPDRYS